MINHTCHSQQVGPVCMLRATTSILQGKLGLRRRKSSPPRCYLSFMLIFVKVHGIPFFFAFLLIWDTTVTLSSLLHSG